MLYWLATGIIILLISKWTISRQKKRNWKEDTIVITGGCGNIGRRLCDHFLHLGAKVILLDRWCNNERYEKYFLQCDLSCPQSIKRALDKCKNVTILVNNCGIQTNGKTFLHVSEEDFDNVVNVNFSSYTRTIRHLLPEMINKKDKQCVIVNMASCLALAGVPYMTDYCASKFAVYGFNEALRLELKTSNVQNVKTLVMCPFFVHNGLFPEINVRFPWLTPTLTADQIARMMVDGIERGREEIWMPWFVHLTPLFRLIPTHAFDCCQFFLGTHDSLRDQ